MNLSSATNKLLRKQSFQPGLLAIFINPFFFLRKGLYKNIKKQSNHLHGNLLDFGCGRKPYKSIIKVTHYVGVDVEVSGHPHSNSEVDVFYDGKTLPFQNDTFDSFFCSEVFEHLFNLEEMIIELKRVLKLNGKGLITTPFAWPEHEQPYDFARYSSFALRSMLEKSGFRIISMDKSGHYFESLTQLTAMYIFSLFKSKSVFLNTLGTVFFIAPINIIGYILSALLPKKYEQFHNLIIVVEKTK